MQLAQHNTLSAHWNGAGRFGVEYVICDNMKVIHRGDKAYIAWQWRKLTGKDL